MTHFRNEYSFLEKKMLNYCLVQLQERNFADIQYTVDTDDVQLYVKWAYTRNTEWMKGLATGLFKKMEWNSFNKDRTEVWTAVPALTFAQLDRKKFRFRVNPELIKKLKESKVFGKIYLLAQLVLQNQYSLGVYEFLSTELSILGAGVTQTEVYTPVDQVRDVLGLGKNQYKQFKDLRRYVLKPVVKDVSDHTNIKVEFDVKKEGKWVRGIVWKMSRKADFQFALPGLEREIEAAATMMVSEEERARLVGLLAEGGVAVTKARQLVASYDGDRIERNVAYAQRRGKSGSVKKLPGYIVAAIEKDFEPASRKDVPAIDVGAAGEGAGLNSGDDPGSAEAGLREAFEGYKDKVLDDFLSTQAEGWITAKKDALAPQLSDDPMFQKAYRRKAWEAEYTKSKFRNWVKGEALVEAHQKDFEAFKVWWLEQQQAA